MRLKPLWSTSIYQPKWWPLAPLQVVHFYLFPMFSKREMETHLCLRNRLNKMTSKWWSCGWAVCCFSCQNWGGLESHRHPTPLSLLLSHNIYVKLFNWGIIRNSYYRTLFVSKMCKNCHILQYNFYIQIDFNFSKRINGSQCQVTS